MALACECPISGDYLEFDGFRFRCIRLHCLYLNDPLKPLPAYDNVPLTVPAQVSLVEPTLSDDTDLQFRLLNHLNQMILPLFLVDCRPPLDADMSAWDMLARKRLNLLLNLDILKYFTLIKTHHTMLNVSV